MCSGASAGLTCIHSSRNASHEIYDELEEGGYGPKTTLVHTRRLVGNADLYFVCVETPGLDFKAERF